MKISIKLLKYVLALAITICKECRIPRSSNKGRKLRNEIRVNVVMMKGTKKGTDTDTKMRVSSEFKSERTKRISEC